MDDMDRLYYICSGICYKILQHISRKNERYERDLLTAVPNQDDVGLRHICFGGYETEIIKFIAERYSKEFAGGTFVDVGAHIGSHTTRLARYFEKVYSFEPNPDTFDLLTLNTSRLNNVLCIREALSNKNDYRQFKSERFNTGKSRITDNIQASNSIVQTKTLDQHHKLLKNISFIKIDVEGHENEVIAGGVEIIKKQKPMLMIEILSDEIHQGTSATLETLSDLGYATFYSLETRSAFDQFFLPTRTPESIKLVFHLVRTLIFGTPKIQCVPLQINDLVKRDYEAILCRC